MRRTLRWLLRLAAGTVLVVLTVLLVVAVQARSKPDLRAWHRSAPASEFVADDAEDGFDLAAYVDREGRVFEELEAWRTEAPPDLPHGRLLRYTRGGTHDPERVAGPWNRTRILPGDGDGDGDGGGGGGGAALLVHGLSDSPYSMKTLAEQLAGQGFTVVCLRLPGHGTVPAGLLDVGWEDWVAAVRVAAAGTAALAGDGPLLLGGYSCGGALVVHEAARALEEGGRVPDRLLLFSPAIGITAFARASNWHEVFSWMPCFEKSRWLDIQPEFDPYKYNSFPKNAGQQMWELTVALRSRLAALDDAGHMDRFPPVLAFQSVVDATIVAADLVHQLFDRLPANGSELVAFDVNHDLIFDDFLAQDPARSLARFFEGDALAYAFTVVTNESPFTEEVEALHRAAGSSVVERVPMGTAWPSGVYSLSHVAVPFPPDDPVYGGDEAPTDGLRLGALAPRGERDVLTIPASQLLRLRFNPFHAAMETRVARWLAEDG